MNEQVRLAAERLRGELEFTDFPTDPRAVDLKLVLDAVQTYPPMAPERETEPLGAKDGSWDHLLDSDALARFKEFLDEMLALGVPEAASLSVRTAYLHALVTALIRAQPSGPVDDAQLQAWQHEHTPKPMQRWHNGTLVDGLWCWACDQPECRVQPILDALRAERARLAESEGREQALREGLATARAWTRGALGHLVEVEYDAGDRIRLDRLRFVSEQLRTAANAIDVALAQPATTELARPDAGGKGQG